MSARDRLLALTIVMVWGINFVVIKVGLEGMPPLLLAGLRFTFVVFPAIFFIKRPAVPVKWLLLYGLTISFGQFAFLFWAIKVGLSAGLASLLLQTQAFITLLLSVALLKEKIHFHHLAAIGVAAIGIYVLASQQSGGTNTITALTLTLILAAASCWAMGNITNKVIMQNYPVPTLSLVVWSALVPTVAFAVAALLFEGPTIILSSLMTIRWHNILALAYLSYLATIFGYGGWSTLLRRYETSVVAPLSLLVPVFGLLGATLLLGESLNRYQLFAVVIIIAGLGVHVFGHKIRLFKLTDNKQTTKFHP